MNRRLAAWFRARGYRVHASNTYMLQDRDVYYRPGDPPQVQLAYLLHEAGHALCGRTSTPRFWDGYAHPRGGKARSLPSAVDLVHEEIEAWHRGYALARRLHIRVNYSEFRRVYGRAVISYFRAAVRRAI